LIEKQNSGQRKAYSVQKKVKNFFKNLWSIKMGVYKMIEKG